MGITVSRHMQTPELWMSFLFQTEEEIYREIIVQGYRVMYRLEKHRVLVLAVMHGSRDLTNPDNQPWITD